MKDFIRKITKKRVTIGSLAKNVKVKDISDTTNAVFERYKKSFKDLARYDREGTIEAN